MLWRIIQGSGCPGSDPVGLKWLPDCSLLVDSHPTEKEIGFAVVPFWKLRHVACDISRLFQPGGSSIEGKAVVRVPGPTALWGEKSGPKIGPGLRSGLANDALDVSL